MLLGNHTPFFAGTAAFITFTMISVVFAEYLALQALVMGAAAMVYLVHTRGSNLFKNLMP